MVGVFLVDKAATWTSRDVVNKLNRNLQFKKLGHTGTLDPFATGLLLVTAGPATKIMAFLNDLPKTYLATLQLGQATATGDTETEVREVQPVKPLTHEEITEALNRFIGEISQTPPLTSALKVDGQPLYKKAHLGEEYSVKSRRVHIFALDLIAYDSSTHRLDFKVQCSSGTYIRTLGQDIALALGTVGYLTALRRTAIGHLRVEQAKDVLDINADDIISIRDALAFMPSVTLDQPSALDAYNGKKLYLPNIAHEDVLVVDQSGQALAVYSYVENDCYQCKRGLL